MYYLQFVVYSISAGGMPESIKMLLDKGAEPNTIGQFGRSPLYRAAFAGHLEAVQVDYIVACYSIIQHLGRLHCRLVQYH